MIVFDTETTGLVKALACDIKHQPSIIEFAAIKLCDTDYSEKSRLHFMVNPLKQLSPEIVKITKITDNMLKDALPFEKRVDELRDFFDGEKNLIAHNLCFDLSMLEIEFSRLGVTDFPMPENKICTVEQSFHINKARMKQSQLYSFATDGLSFEGAHRAINDVEALTTCVVWLIENNCIKLA